MAAVTMTVPGSVGLAFRPVTRLRDNVAPLQLDALEQEKRGRHHRADTLHVHLEAGGLRVLVEYYSHLPAKWRAKLKQTPPIRDGLAGLADASLGPRSIEKELQPVKQRSGLQYPWYSAQTVSGPQRRLLPPARFGVVPYLVDESLPPQGLGGSFGPPETRFTTGIWWWSLRSFEAIAAEKEPTMQLRHIAFITPSAPLLAKSAAQPLYLKARVNVGTSRGPPTEGQGRVLRLASLRPEGGWEVDHEV